MATQLTADIKQKNITNNKLIDSFKFYSDLIRQYQVDATNTIKKIVSNSENNPELAEEFKDIAKGLEGEFTRATAIEMGKQKLISKLDRSVDDLIEDYSSIQEYVSKPQEDLKTIFTSVDTNVNIESLLDRRTRYNRSNLERDFMSKKLVGVLGTTTAKLRASLTPKQFLVSIKEVLAIIRIFEFKEIQTAINVYYNKCIHIADNFKYIGKQGEFHPEQNKIEHQLIEQTGDDKLHLLLQQVHQEAEPEDAELAIFDQLLDDLSATRDRLIEIIEQLGNVISSLNLPEFNVAMTYGPGIKDFIALYSKTEITNEEFLSKLRDSLIILYNTNAVETDILNVFSNAISNLNNYVYIFNLTYSICEEATVKGTVIDGQVNISLSKK